MWGVDCDRTGCPLFVKVAEFSRKDVIASMPWCQGGRVGTAFVTLCVWQCDVFYKEEDWITCSRVMGKLGLLKGRIFGSIPLSSCVLFCIVEVVQKLSPVC